MEQIVSLIRRLSVALAIAYSLSGCIEGQQDQNVIASNPGKGEVLGAKNIAAFFGGTCTKTYGLVKNKSGNSDRVFRLSVEDSKVLNDYEDRMQMAATNVAYRFYSCLKPEEHKSFDELHVVLYPSDTTKRDSFIIDKARLQFYEQKMIVMEEVVNLLKSKNYNQLQSQIDGSVLGVNTTELISNIRLMDSTMGHILDFRLFGFEELTPTESTQFLRISGGLIRQKKNCYLNILLAPSPDSNAIFLLNYQL